MANLNRIILVGRLTADPEVRSTTEGLPVAKFRLAVNRFGGGREEVDFMDVVAWRRLAEICGQYLKRGRLVLVEGRIQNRSFEDSMGQRRWVTEVIARNMQMLERGLGDREIRGSGKTNEEEAGAETLGEEVIDDSELESDLPF